VFPVRDDSPQDEENTYSRTVNNNRTPKTCRCYDKDNPKCQSCSKIPERNKKKTEGHNTVSEPVNDSNSKDADDHHSEDSIGNKIVMTGGVITISGILMRSTIATTMGFVTVLLGASLDMLEGE
jgi:hypothetical protein